MENTSLPFENAMKVPDWAKELPIAITVCDENALIIYMNDKSSLTFNNSGGLELIGKSLFECHSAYSNEIIKELLQTGRSNTYTMEKNGVKKMICQTPWFKSGKVAGLVEISIQIPDTMPHFIRQ